jgi:hypothetical protein
VESLRGETDGNGDEEDIQPRVEDEPAGRLDKVELVALIDVMVAEEGRRLVRRHDVYRK